MERKLAVVFNYDKLTDQLSTVYKVSQVTPHSVVIGVFEHRVLGDPNPRMTEYMFFENTNRVTTCLRIYHPYRHDPRESMNAYNVSQSSLSIEKQSDLLAQLGLFGKDVYIALYSTWARIGRMNDPEHHTPYRLELMNYLDSYDRRNVYVTDVDGDLINVDDDIYYWKHGDIIDRVTQDKIDDNDLVYAHDIECYIESYDATYINDADYYVADTYGYYICEVSNEWYTRDGVVIDDYTVLSREVFENDYFICELCDQIHHLDYCNHDEYHDHYICDNCWMDRDTGPIRDYHDNPPLVKYTTGDRFTGGYGFELEVDDSYTSNPIDLATDIDESFYEKVWMSHDGSLNDGLEIISHPMTLDYIMNKFDMKRLCDIVSNHGFKSHDTSTCGLHVHASRELFGKDTTEQELTIAKIILLFNRFYENELVTFSRRNYSRLNSWAKKSKVKFERGDTRDDISEKLRQARREGRYQAVNLNNRHTVEFRIFRGTTKASTILASIQFVDELIKYAKTHSLYVCTIVNFNTIFKNTKHVELKNYLIDRKLMKKGDFKKCV